MSEAQLDLFTRTLSENATQYAADSTRPAGRMANTNGWHPGTERQQCGGQQRQQPQDGGAVGSLGDAGSAGLSGAECHGVQGSGRRGEGGAIAEPGGAPTWIQCTDGNLRPASAEPGAFPLAHGIPRDLGRGKPELAGLARRAGRNRVIRLKGYGNAIVPRVAAEFVAVVMEITAPSAQRRAG